MTLEKTGQANYAGLYFIFENFTASDPRLIAEVGVLVADNRDLLYFAQNIKFSECLS
ncbi:hypothetical protein NIES2098_39460 [Calothrix sp. NIES-2098]|nr:hypothetical protein NIES2098_39460 [Calothrix sp. NIES-2098]